MTSASSPKPSCAASARKPIADRRGTAAGLRPAGAAALAFCLALAGTAPALRAGERVLTERAEKATPAKPRRAQREGSLVEGSLVQGSLVGQGITVVPDDDYAFAPPGSAAPHFPYDRRDFDPGRPRYDHGGPGYYRPERPQGPILPIFPHDARRLFPDRPGAPALSHD